MNNSEKSTDELKKTLDTLPRYSTASKDIQIELFNRGIFYQPEQWIADKKEFDDMVKDMMKNNKPKPTYSEKFYQKFWSKHE